MRVIAVFVALFLTNACALRKAQTTAFLDPSFAPLIPHDTTVLVGASVERIVKTPVYQKYLKGVPLPGVESFRNRTGVDVESKLWQVLWVSNGVDNFWLARGKFADDLTTADFSHRGAPAFAYKGATLFGDEQSAVIPFSSTTAGLGETKALRRLLDQRQSTAAPPPRLGAMVEKVPHDPQIWGVWSGGSLDLTLPGNWANATRVLNSMENGMFTVTLSDRVNAVVSGTAISDKAAEDVNGALSTLLSLARSGSKDGKTQALLQGLQITREGRQITITADAPPEALELLLK